MFKQISYPEQYEKFGINTSTMSEDVLTMLNETMLSDHLLNMRKAGVAIGLPAIQAIDMAQKGILIQQNWLMIGLLSRLVEAKSA